MNAAPQSYLARVVAFVAIVALALLAWRLLDVIVLLFAAVLMAVALRTLARPLQEHLKLPAPLALALVVLGGLAVIALAIWLLGDRVAEQFANLRAALPPALDAARNWLDSQPFGQTLLELWSNAKSGEAFWARLASLATMTLGAISSVLLVVVIAIYLAADPALYRRGLLHLLPLEQRPAVDGALQAAGEGLSRWLLGQGLSMLAIGTLTSIGLALLGMPLALSLGVIAGLFAFVPFFGAVTSGVLIVVLSFAQGPDKALQAAVLMLAVQQFEDMVLLPFIQRWAVRLPPVLGLVAAVMFALLFGPVGVLVATPLMVLLMILIQRLYVDRVVETPRAEAEAAAGAAPRRDVQAVE
ncbi:MAG: AI-2E family transporter [Methylibium sp.]|uniref:AI-2E family transporter n=1 Tax=Methylibium sp. TaxID=2067992 RepID=UPI0017933B8A|nr:AI-2E family transporter [Methylibium sp.]MBA3598305.1 AI-2E family transporter [Methylibium sp.]